MYQKNGKGSTKNNNSVGTIYVNKPKDGKQGYLNISIDLAALGVGTGMLAVKAFKNEHKTESKHPDYRILKPLSGQGKTAKPATAASATSSTDDGELPF